MRLLLDVNIWIALLDDAHVHSAAANALLDEPGLQIASCPIIENGVIRILNLPSYGNAGPFGLKRVRNQLAQAYLVLDHAFWPDDLSLCQSDAVDFSRVRGHNQITDAYLLALAVRNNGCLASFDQGIALSAVRGAQPRHLRLIK